MNLKGLVDQPLCVLLQESVEASALVEKGLLAPWALPPGQGPPECVADL